jgi:hypothetical protein
MTTFKNISDGEYMRDKISCLRLYFNNFSTLLQVLMNCLGRTSCEPYTASAGENSLSSRKAVLIPSSTQGRWSCQSAAAARDRRASFSRLWNRSTNPFD